MGFRMDSFSPFPRRIGALPAGLALLLGVAGPVGARGPVLELPSSSVHDEAGLLSTGVRSAVEEEIDRYREQTGCRIVVTTYPRITDRKQVQRSFAAWWKSWGRPECTAVIFLIEDELNARLVVSPELRPRVSIEEGKAVLRGAIVPRFEAGDPDGAVLAGVESLRSALEGELRELPSPFRPSPADLARGTVLLLVAIAAFAGAAYQLHQAWRERRS